ncbi:MAG: 16S rRNA (cytidine(1402)-2'-O)-methyltransferase, partial [Thermoanaerobaculia bacterium]
LPPRARLGFEEADLVLCEDTRHTGRLLSSLGLDKRLMSLHEHNERGRVGGLMEMLRQGATLVLASDAGTPLISDPGFLLVREAVAAGIPVEHRPGPSAVVSALVVSGLPPYPFTFAGFPPRKRGKRRRFYHSLGGLDHTLVLFESPHRLLASLDDAAVELGNRPAAIARELTKLHEEVLHGRLIQLREELADRRGLKGEFTLVIAPPDKG